MYYREHEPAHFHAEHSGDGATFDFEGRVLSGRIRSARARRSIEEWAILHHRELAANWERMKAGEQLEAIEPLK